METGSKIIAFTGLIGSGKTTAANYVVHRYGYHKLPFAEGLKSMMMALGLTYDQVYGDQKEIPLSILCGKTPRYAMQTLGTEWGRQLIGENFWPNLWKANAEQYSNRVTCDDCRFPNEATVVRSIGGIVVKIIRSSVKPGTHPSETEMVKILPDYVLTNDGLPEMLFEKIDKIMKGEW